MSMFEKRRDLLTKMNFSYVRRTRVSHLRTFESVVTYDIVNNKWWVNRVQFSFNDILDIYQGTEIGEKLLFNSHLF